MKSLRCTAVLGTAAKYNLNGFCIDLMNILKFVSDANPDKYFISFNVTESITCYKEEWGCSEDGEHTFNLEAVANPTFVDDLYKWKEDCIFYIKTLQDIFRQKTVSIQFSEVDFIYSLNDENKTDE